MNRPSFSLDEFKKWLKEQETQNNKSSLIGTLVESRISVKKLSSKICIEEGDVHEVICDFKKNGGTIADIDGKCFLVEVGSGSFYIPKMYVSRG